MPATTIWMGDLLACLNELAPADDNTAEAIAGLLGFERIAGPARRPASPVPSASPEQPTPFVPETPAAVPDGVGPSAPAQVASPSSAAAPLPSAAPPAKPRREEMVPDGAGPSASAWVAPPSFPVDRLPPIAPRWSPDTRDDTVTPLRLTEVDSSPPLAPVPLLSPLAGRFIVQELIISRQPGRSRTSTAWSRPWPAVRFPSRSRGRNPGRWPGGLRCSSTTARAWSRSPAISAHSSSSSAGWRARRSSRCRPSTSRPTQGPGRSLDAAAARHTRARADRSRPGRADRTAHAQPGRRLAVRRLDPGSAGLEPYRLDSLPTRPLPRAAGRRHMPGALGQAHDDGPGSPGAA